MRSSKKFSIVKINNFQNIGNLYYLYFNLKAFLLKMLIEGVPD